MEPGYDPAAYAAGLRRLAKIILANPGMCPPYGGVGSPLLFQPHSASEFLSAARAIGCKWVLTEWTSAGTGMPYFAVLGQLDGLRIELIAPLDELESGVAALRAEFAPGGGS